MSSGSHLSRWSSLAAKLAVLLVGLLGASAVATVVLSGVSVRQVESRNADQSMANVHRSTALSIEQTSTDLDRFESSALEARKDLLADLMAAQISAIDTLRTAAERGEITEAAARSAAEQMLFDFRYGDNDYFFVFTPEMVSIVEPNPTFEGNMIDYQDSTGKYFFREFQEVALGPGSGYVDYVGTRAGQSQPAPKVSYITYYEPWQWVVGTGVYLDDITAEADARAEMARVELSAALANVEFGGDGFFFVLGSDGEVVVAPSGQDLSVLGDQAWGREVTSALLTAEPPPDGTINEVVRSARFTEDRNEEWRMKVSSVTGRQPWLLVSAVPQSQLAAVGNLLAIRQVMLSAVVLIFGLLVGLFTSRRLVRPVQDLTASAVALEQDRFDAGMLDTAAARRDEMGVLARAFRRMAAEVVERERALRERVSRLQVVVDRQKVDDEIDQITESDFFRHLEERAEELRRRE
jgi:HAMP domain-containing protein